MSGAEVEALATVPLQHIAQQHLVDTPPSSLLAEFLGGEGREDMAPCIMSKWGFDHQNWGLENQKREKQIGHSRLGLTIQNGDLR